jgi:hypothetical protein
MKYILGPVGKQKELDFSLIQFRDKGLTVNGMLGGYKKFGVYFSGGLDSTITLCLLIKELKEKQKVDESSVTCYTVCKTSGSTYYANRMLGKVQEMFNVKINHITNLENPAINLTPTPLAFHTIVDLVSQYKDTLFFTGLLSYPNKSEKDFVYKESMSNLPDSGLPNNRVVQPLWNLYKYHVVDLYYQMNVESLIPYTHTCTKQSIGTCNMCTGCEERQWAFDVLGKQDPEPIMPDIDDLSNNGTWKFMDPSSNG